MTLRAVAHRGFSTKYPENTLAAFEAALTFGVSHVELDVHLSKEGVPVVIHDHTLDRTTSLSGPVSQFTVDQLRKADAGNGEFVPTLEEALLCLKHRAKVAVELKQMGQTYPMLEEKTIAIIERVGMINDVYINSFDHYAIEHVRTLHSTVETGLIMHSISPAVFPFMKKIKASSIAVRVESVTEDFVETCRSEGATLIVWPVDSREQFICVAPYPDVLPTVNALDVFQALVEEKA
ncbi:glycerophosphodiester phosphodiesterase [Aureibacillus halotolerans]|uniref:Glycerophosphoryl diester phosphodiesterase n=1 Tax=Aureibacillus halotolerans TaxID=1508390 RepID=A0A4V3D4T3_9BACI|nr:glycerophosphodiester phosphodiesterase family protein [Aureibacillus halotolerans]TDQ37187.1 glycerophosphoryl diester phosphodiesterase [Aureibacillus halotolerans]